MDLKIDKANLKGVEGGRPSGHFGKRSRVKQNNKSHLNREGWLWVRAGGRGDCEKRGRRKGARGFSSCSVRCECGEP